MWDQYTPHHASHAIFHMVGFKGVYSNLVQEAVLDGLLELDRPALKRVLLALVSKL